MVAPGGSRDFEDETKFERWMKPSVIDGKIQVRRCLLLVIDDVGGLRDSPSPLACLVALYSFFSYTDITIARRV
jgi:hypothetical protein